VGVVHARPVYIKVAWPLAFPLRRSIPSIQICAAGLLLNGPGSYLRSAWNIMDLTVVGAGILVLVTAALNTSANVMWLRAIRALRALRPLRAANRVVGGFRVWRGCKGCSVQATAHRCARCRRRRRRPP
jgi:hypothetical protein